MLSVLLQRTATAWRVGVRRVIGTAERRRVDARIVAPMLLLASLLLVRLQLARELDYGVGQALRFGIVSGLVRDGVAVTLASLVGISLWSTLAWPRWAGWMLGATLVWAASVANVVYFRFFGMPLDWWIVRLHWRDAGVVGGSAVSLGSSNLVVASAAVGLVALVVSPWLGASTAPRTWRGRLRAAGRPTLGLLVLFVLCWRGPSWLGIHGGTRPLNDSIVRMWAEQNFRGGLYSGVSGDWEGILRETSDAPDPGTVLAAYRDLDPRGDVPVPDLATPRGEWPLHRTLRVDTQRARDLRASLGLDPETAPNVIVLFLESVRAYELLHPEIGPVLFPRVRKVLAEHAVQFAEAYTSSLTAGETVRGQFSALCSMLPNALGAATYIAHTTVRVECLQRFAVAQGYRTAWMNSFRKNFHGKQAFESLHGTELFFDEEHFLARGIRQRIGRWGLADQPFLQETLRLVEELAAQGRPVLANVLTISTHHPYSVVPEGPIPAELAAAAREDEDYAGYLSRLRYVDGAVGDFFAALFASPLARNTLVVMLGDHGASVAPHGALGPAQHEEVRFRIPLAFVTAWLPTPRTERYPVHQIDVAPSIAAVMGGEAVVTWVGRSVWDGAGSPWVYATDDGIAYRFPDRGCYPAVGTGALRCFDTRGRDPLYAAELPGVPEDAGMSAFVRHVFPAVMRAIAFNQIEPPMPTPGVAAVGDPR